MLDQLVTLRKHEQYQTKKKTELKIKPSPSSCDQEDDDAPSKTDQKVSHCVLFIGTRMKHELTHSPVYLCEIKGLFFVNHVFWSSFGH
jgi:hypothetical protein